VSDDQRAFAPTHARIVYLLAERGELTDTQLVRRLSTKTERTSAPWPYMAESSARARRKNLVDWGVVEQTAERGKTPSGAPSRRWRLVEPAPLALPADAHPLLAQALERLLEEAAGDLTIRASLQDVARATLGGTL
jgi:predicted ArsR family transcriptional regulator